MSDHQPTKYYWVQCSDGGYVSMSEERLEFLLDLMPTLRFLLLGHPRMKPKELPVLEDGTQILKIPADFRVSQKAFLLLVNCVFEAKPIPARGKGTDDMAVLEETMATLGGCEVLEQRLKDHRTNPLTPEEDTNDDYEWQALHMSKTEDIRMEMMTKLSNAGFGYTTSIRENGSIMVTRLYRKKK